MHRYRCTLVLGVIATGILAGPIAGAAPSLSIESDTSLATAGFYQLRWEAGKDDIRLVEAMNASFADARTVYVGPDTARVISGKPDGDYYYRLEFAAAPDIVQPIVVSDTIRVTVEHHSLARAFGFFAVGAAVFAATLGLILVGGRHERR